MSYRGAFAFDRNSPLGAAVARPKASPPASEPVESLSKRLDAELAAIKANGFRVHSLEIGEAALVTLFSESGENAIRLDPDPAIDKAWYGDHEVRASDKIGVWIWVGGEVFGELSAHVVA